MWRASILALALGACAPHAGHITPLGDTLAPAAEGDFDGDRRGDRAAFYETDEGVLAIFVTRAARPQERLQIWGGDISSAPYFSVRTAPPGAYYTDCEAYGGCSSTPSQIELPHDGLIVEGSADGSRTLYYWQGGRFLDVSIR